MAKKIELNFHSIFKGESQKKIYLIFSFSFLCSCATLTSRSQLISIDSSPRGANVYLKSKLRKIGTTPFFYELPRTNAIKLKFKPTGKSQGNVYNQTCSFRWFVAGLGNLPFFTLSPYAGVAAFAYDFFSKNVWNCDDHIVANLKHRPKNKQCHHFFVVPPYHKNPSKAFQLYEEWKKIITDKIASCHSFVSNIDLKRYHRSFNLGLHRKFTYKKVKKHKIKKIGYATGADVFVTLNFDEKNPDVLIANYIDMHKDTEILHFPHATKINIKNHREEVISDNVFSFAIELFPNSFGYEFRSTLHTKDTFEENRSPNRTLPVLVTSFSLLSMTGPEAYDEWDIAYGLYPRLNFYSFDWTYIFESPKEELRWRLYYLMFAYEGRMTFFTALGQLSLGLGWGPMLVYSKPYDLAAEFVFSNFNTAYFRYTAHLSKSLFLYLDTSMFFPARRFYLRDSIQSASFLDVTVGLGYFLQDLKADFLI